MANPPKILVCTPTSEYKDYCAHEFIYTAQSFNYDNYELLVVDNSQNPDYHKKFEYHGVTVEHIPPQPGRPARETMLDSNNLCREIFLRGDYDYFFSLESDIFPPTDIITRLLLHIKASKGKAHVIGAPYFIMKRKQTCAMLMENDVLLDYGNFKLLTSDSAFLHSKGGLMRTNACGLGCLMISRQVIEKVPFRINRDEDGHVDSFFHSDLEKHNIKVYVDTECYVEHRNQDWATILENQWNK